MMPCLDGMRFVGNVGVATNGIIDQRALFVGTWTKFADSSVGERLEFVDEGSRLSIMCSRPFKIYPYCL